ncbi:MAG: 23S rRNA (adenine(2503)-C(2))-methyltransferase RlmN [Rhabdochlamydiaceae bacterium]
MSLLSFTQAEFVDQMASCFGKGRRHGARLYQEWMRKGHLDDLSWAEPQALPLVEKMISQMPKEIDPVSKVLEEGDVIKFLIRLQDGLETESVIIPMKAGLTLCVSSQVGCKMGCAFCETGRMGLIRSLKVEEITQQLFIARHVLKKPIRNVVFMGMGEPFDNYDAVMQAIKVMTDPSGFGLGPRHITVSTSGVVDALDRFTVEADPAIHLAVSINAPGDLIRTKIMPVGRKWSMSELKEALYRYVQKGRREILVEYVLLKDLNDTKEHAEQLAEYLKGLPVKVNLIPYNSQRRTRYSPPEMEKQEAFFQTLREKNYQVNLRHHKGRGIMAACGQLGNKVGNKEIQKSLRCV